MKISVIIPTLNEEEIIEHTLRDLVENHAPDEVIVSDGGSTDRTVEIASNFACILRTRRGRAQQMNDGVKKATGDAFLFLHADTGLPLKGLETVHHLLTTSKTEAGRFRMCFDEGGLLLKFYAYYTRFHFFSYGDQAFFLTRNIFERIGGFSEQVPFEDIDFYKRLRKVTKPVIIKHHVTTSSRRFLKVGKFRQKWINLLLVTLYYLGWDILPLKRRFYPEVR